MLPQKRQMTNAQIIEAYRRGERNFSGIVCMQTDFPKAKLSGSDFSNSNLSFCNFKHADISDCNFTGANLEWSSFKDADLRRSDFTRASFSHSVLNKAKFDGAVLTKTNASWCLMFDVTGLDRKSADFTMTAFHPSDVTKEGRETIMRELGAMKNDLPFEVYFELQMIVKTGNEELHKINIAQDTQVKATYGKINTGNLNAGNYSVQTPAGSYDNTSYTTKRKKKDVYTD